MKILKFGGTSVSSYVSLQRMLGIVNQLCLSGEPVVVVVSALKEVTDKLNLAGYLAARGDEQYKSVYFDVKQIHNELSASLFGKEDELALKEVLDILFLNLLKTLEELFNRRRVTKREIDEIMAYGERLSATLITKFLNSKNIAIEFLDARKVIITDKAYGDAKVNMPSTIRKIKDYFQTNPGNKVVTGFIASAPDGSTTTLGRGGSDYTATILGVAMEVENIVKWTDVDGIMTSDPNLTKEPYPVSNITFNELFHLSKFSRGVLVHPEAIYPLSKKNIPFIIKNTFNNNFKGTVISNDAKMYTKIFSLHDHCLLLRLNKKNIALKMALKMIDKRMKLFIKVDSMGEWSYYIVSKEDLVILSSALKKGKFFPMTNRRNLYIVNRKIALVTVTGESMEIMKEREEMENLLRINKVDIIASRCMLHSILFAIHASDATLALNILHNETYSIFAGNKDGKDKNSDEVFTLEAF